jgi:hypothetical protein
MRLRGVLVLILSVVTAEAQSCKGQVVTRNGPAGAVTMCLDGKYSTCLRDAQRLGWSKQAAKANCDNKRAQGLVQ